MQEPIFVVLAEWADVDPNNSDLDAVIKGHSHDVRDLRDYVEKAIEEHTNINSHGIMSKLVGMIKEKYGKLLVEKNF